MSRKTARLQRGPQPQKSPEVLEVGGQKSSIPSGTAASQLPAAGHLNRPSEQFEAEGTDRAGAGAKAGAEFRQKRFPLWLVVIGAGVVIWAVIAFLLLSGGKSEPKPVATLNTPDIHALAFNPAQPETVYFGSHNGLLKSRDNGLSWQPTNLANLDAMGIGVAGDGKTVYISGHAVFSRSDDGGITWRSLLDRLAGTGATDVHALAVDPTNPARLYIFSVGAGLMKSEDSGQHWQVVSKQLANGLVSLALGNNTLWAAVTGRGVLRSQDGGNSWEAASGYANAALDTNNKVAALAFNPNSNTLYAGTVNGLFLSSDGGSSWNGSGYTQPVAALAVNPVNPKNILLVNTRGEVYRSLDGGLSWPGN